MIMRWYRKYFPPAPEQAVKDKEVAKEILSAVEALNRALQKAKQRGLDVGLAERKLDWGGWDNIYSAQRLELQVRHVTRSHGITEV